MSQGTTGASPETWIGPSTRKKKHGFGRQMSSFLLASPGRRWTLCFEEPREKSAERWRPTERKRWNLPCILVIKWELRTSRRSAITLFFHVPGSGQCTKRNCCRKVIKCGTYTLLTSIVLTYYFGVTFMDLFNWLFKLLMQLIGKYILLKIGACFASWLWCPNCLTFFSVFFPAIRWCGPVPAFTFRSTMRVSPNTETRVTNRNNLVVSDSIRMQVLIKGFRIYVWGPLKCTLHRGVFFCVENVHLHLFRFPAILPSNINLVVRLLS